MHFKEPRVNFGGKSHSFPAYIQTKTTTTNADSFFRLNFSVYINLNNKERARARDKNQRRQNFIGRKTKTFYSGGEKKGKS